MKFSILIGGGVAVLLLSSCTKIANFAEERANRAAYANIRGAQQSALGSSDPFSIDQADQEMINDLLEMDRQQAEAQILSLSDVLAISMINSRSYQTEKESLYLTALNLTETQKDFNWKSIDDSYARVSTSETLYDGDDTNETFGVNGVTGKIKVGIQKTLLTGAKISLDYTQNLVELFSTTEQSSENAVLSFDVVQPLLRGFGPLMAKEDLRQAERDMIYEVRDFKRFQQDFVIDIAEQYYDALSARDTLSNERKSYEASMLSREQSESYAKAGRIADFEAAQARQSELNAADRWTLARSAYQKALDDLRYTLGLPVDLNVEPDSGELTELELRGLVELDVDLSIALDLAISNRLDIINAREKVVDQERLLEIQKREFLPQLDASYSVDKYISSSSDTELEQTFKVELDLPFDWTEKRNAYRKAQINLERQRRSLEGDESDVRRDIRDLWRKLGRNRSVYKNRLLSVKLSERRVENTTLLLKQGKALTRDLLDAEDDLLSSRNEATEALVDYTINRLRFWNAIERFEIDPKGMWYEQSDTEDAVATP